MKIMKGMIVMMVLAMFVLSSCASKEMPKDSLEQQESSEVQTIEPTSAGSQEEVLIDMDSVESDMDDTDLEGLDTELEELDW
jgi:PBP1b-binding outer membrane lipoprotein LpoB